MGTAPSRVIQCFPENFYNKTTQRLFRVTQGKGLGQSALFKGFGIEAEDLTNDGKSQRGYADYKISGKILELHTIFAVPEDQQSYLGSLLMYLVADEAKNNGCTTIEVLDSAPKARGFYEHLGCKPDLTGIDPTKMSKAEYLLLSQQVPLAGTVNDVIGRAAESVVKRWEADRWKKLGIPAEVHPTHGQMFNISLD